MQAGLSPHTLAGAGPGSLVMCAPTCSSWCRVSRATSCRTILNPAGDESIPFVREGNLTISRQPTRRQHVLDPRLTLVLLVAMANHAVWVLEQPMGSADILPKQNRLDWLFNEVVFAACPFAICFQI